MAQALARKEPPSGHLHEVTASALRVPGPSPRTQAQSPGPRPKAHSQSGIQVKSSQVKVKVKETNWGQSSLGLGICFRKKPRPFSSLSSCSSSSSQRHTNPPYCPLAHLTSTLSERACYHIPEVTLKKTPFAARHSYSNFHSVTLCISNLAPC